MHKPDPNRLIIRYLTREATPAEEQALLRWLAEHPSHQHILDEHIQVWRQSNPGKFNLAKGLDRLNERIDAFQEETTMAAERRGFPWFRIAASMAAVAVAGVAVYILLNTTRAQLPRYTQLESQDRRRQVLLPDGSKVVLNSRSRLRFHEPFSANRAVELDGEAFFEVKRDSLHPFTVHTGALATRVLGTSFNIKRAGDTIQVSVVTGSVRVSDPQHAESLSPEQGITYFVHTQKMIADSVDLAKAITWKNDSLAFNDDTLVTAAKKLSVAFGVHVTFAHPSIGSCRVTGRYANPSLKTVLKAICYSTGLQVVQKNNTVIFYGSGCGE